MITTIEGDLLDFPDGLQIIAHGCNTLNLMRSGLALQMVKRYPQVLEADDLARKECRNCLGKVSVAELKDPERWVINLYQQDKLRQLNSLALQKALMAAAGMARSITPEEGPIVRIGVPYKLGCGLAAGNWVDVMSILHQVDKEYPDHIVIVKRPQDA